MFACTSSGVPSAIFSPWSSTMTLSADLIDDVELVLDQQRSSRRARAGAGSARRAPASRPGSCRRSARRAAAARARRRARGRSRAGADWHRRALDARWSTRGISRLPKMREDFERALARRRFLAQRPGRAQHGADGAGRSARMHADQHVLQHRHVGEQAQVLEGARDAALDDDMRRQAGRCPRPRAGPCRRRAREAGDEIEEGRSCPSRSGR